MLEKVPNIVILSVDAMIADCRTLINMRGEQEPKIQSARTTVGSSSRLGAGPSRHPPDGAGVVVASVQGVAEILTYTLQFPPAFPVQTHRLKWNEPSAPTISPFDPF